MKNSSVAVVLAVMLTAVSTYGQGEKVAYDTYCKLPEASRRATLAKMAPLNIYEIAATHLQRFFVANENRLSREQLIALEKAITPLTIAISNGRVEADQSEATLRASENSLANHFGSTELAQLSHVRGGCIARR